MRIWPTPSGTMVSEALFRHLGVATQTSSELDRDILAKRPA